MKAALTPADVTAILAERVDAGWLAQLQGTPDGLVLLGALQDLAIAADAADARRFSARFTQPYSGQIGAVASGATQATVTLAITRTLGGFPLTLPAGTQVQTVDGHVFTTNASITFGAGQTGTPQTVSATAKAFGSIGVIPPGEINAFVPVANQISGVGTATAGDIELVTVLGFPSLQLRTDKTQPSPFKSTLIGLYLQIVAAPTSPGNLGRVMQIAQVTDVATFAGTPALEGQYVWTQPGTTGTDIASWTTGLQSYTWQVRDWFELGLVVTNTTAVVDGVDGTLDDAATVHGAPRRAGELDAAVRRRLGRQPQKPSPLGLLRKAIEVLVPYGLGRLDLQVYELGLGPPDSVDPYAGNFPAAAGMVRDFHARDMPSPVTPALLAPLNVNGALIGSWANPGLALRLAGDRPWDVVVRWDPPGGMPAPTVASIRVLLFAAIKAAVQPGCVMQIYNPSSWEYPP